MNAPMPQFFNFPLTKEFTFKWVFLPIFLLLNSLNINAQFILNGSARDIGGGCYQLTRDRDNQTGNILSDQAIDLTKPFFVDAFINFGTKNNSGADGIAFIITSDNNLSGQTGGGIGYLNIAPSIIVEMDDWANGIYSDPNQDHIAIVKNGDPEHFGSNSLAAPVTLPNIEDGDDHCFRMSWNPDTKEFVAFLDGTRVRYFGDIVNEIFGGDPIVFWGFTASTGGSNNNQTVCINGSETTVEPMLDTIICAGLDVELEATPNGQSYTWNADPTLSSTNIPNPIALPDDTTQYIVNVAFQCGGRYIDTVEVIPFVPPIEIEPIGPICEFDDPYFVNVAPAGGFLDGIGIDGDYFDPVISGIGSFDIIYEVTERGCTKDSTITIDVNEVTPVMITPLREFCENEVDFQVVFSPTGGDWRGDVTSTGMIQPSVLGEGNFSATYVFTNSNNCKDSLMVPFKINPKPHVTISAIAPLCVNSDSITLNVAPLGGNWSGTTLDSLIVPEQFGVGSFETIYEFTDNKGCVGTDTFNIVVNDLPTIVFDPVSPNCGNAPADTIGINPIGGVWSGSVDGIGSFDPITLVPGTFSAYYEFTDGNNCTNNDSIQFIINPVPVVEIASVPNLCETESPVILSGTPMNGNWSGAVTTDGRFVPVNGVVGNNEIIYQFTNSFGCVEDDTIQITILDNPEINLNSPQVYCENLTSATLSTNLSPGTWSGVVDASGMISPSTLGDGMFGAEYRYSDAQGCSDTVNFQIEILPIPIVDFSNIGPFCENINTQTIIANPTGGTWSGITNTVGAFEPNSLSAGMHDFSYQFMDLNGCLTDTTLSIQINPAPFVQISPLDSLCLDGLATQLNATPPTGDWSGVVNSAGMVEPMNLGVGNHEAIYSFTNQLGCTKSDTIEVIIRQPDLIVFPAIAPFCLENQNHQLSATPMGGEWSGDVSIDGFFNPTDLGFGNFDAQYTFTSSTGCVVSSRTNFSIIEPIDIVFGNNVFCQNDLTQQLSVTPMGGTWSGSSVSPNGSIFPPDFAVGNTTLEYTFIQLPGNCSITEQVDITINEVPDLEILGDTSFCQTLSEQSFIGNPVNGTWSGVANNNGSVDPSILNVGGHTVTYSFTSQDQCSNSIDQEIIITPPPTAIFTGNETICAGEGPIDLGINFTGQAPFDLTISDGQISTTITGLNQGDDYAVNPSATTIYTITLVADAECNNTISSTATVAVNPAPFATITPTFEICNSAETGEKTILDFSTLITDGDTRGSWMDINNSGAIGSFSNLDFDGVASGIYTFEYTTNSAASPCVEQKYTTQITVIDCKCPSVETSAPPPLCTTDALLDLRSLKVTTEAGSWTIQSEPTNSSATLIGDDFNGTGSVAGQYIIQFNLSQPTPGPCSENSTQIIELSAPPFAEIPSVVDVCNSTAAGNTTILNFTTLITGGDNTGTWSAIDNSGAFGTLPVLDFENIPEGQFKFSYTTATAVAPCTNQTFEIIINVRDCSCPSVSTGSAGPFCSDDVMLDLSTITFSSEPGSWSISNAPVGSTASILGQNFNATNSVSGDYELIFRLDQTPPSACPPSSTQIIAVNSAPFAEVSTFGEACNSTILGDPTTFDFNTLILNGDDTGIWEDLDGSGAIGAFPVLDFLNITPGQYRFRNTLTGTPPCSDLVFETMISVIDCACPSVSTAPAGPFCNDDATLDLSSITLTSEDGNWFLTNSPTGSTAGIAGGIFSANGSVGGDYELTYIINAIAPIGCPQSSTQVIQVGEVVTAGNSPGQLQLCNDGSLIDLNAELIDASPNGYWRDLSAILADGFDETTGIIDGSILQSGTYEFVYVANTIAPCEKDSIRFTLEVETPLNQGALIDNLVLCEGIDSTVSLYDLIEGYDLGGVWSQISGAPINSLNSTDGVINLASLSNDRFIFEYRVNSTGLCPTGFVRAEIIVNPTPIADAGDDFEIDCDNRIITIGIPPTGTPNLVYEWSENVSDPLMAQPIVNQGGTYILKVSDELTGCFSTDEMIVLEGSGIPQLEIEGMDITCFGENDGTINMSNISGGQPPYLYSINGGVFSNQIRFDELPPGNYTIEVKDAADCTDSEMFEIIEPQELSILLSSTLIAGENFIEFGDSVTLTANITGIYDTIIWKPNEGLDTCNNGCLSQVVKPDISTTYRITIVNEQGCTANTNFSVIVINPRDIYIPTAFSPNDDGLNDIFQIFIGDNIVKVNTFAIYDRWGEEMYRKSDFVPDNSTDGWDGRYRGKYLQSGVFVYYAEIEFADGAKVLYKGDLTLIR